MLARFTQWQGRAPESVAADTTYGNAEFPQWLADRSITPYMRTRDSIHRKKSPFYGPERFTYEPENNRYICPAGQPLNYGRVHRNRAYNYIGTRKRCIPCSQRPQCTSAAFRSLIIHQNEPTRQRARELVNTPEFAQVLFVSSSSWRRLHRTSSDSCGSSANRQQRFCQPRLSRTQCRNSAGTFLPDDNDVLPSYFFNTHRR
jgi:hypothetical protein